MSQNPTPATHRNVTLQSGESENVGGLKVRVGLPSGGMDATIDIDGRSYNIDSHYSAHSSNVQTVTNNGPGDVDLLIFS